MGIKHMTLTVAMTFLITVFTGTVGCADYHDNSVVETSNLKVKGEEPGYHRDSIPDEGLFYLKYDRFDFKAVRGRWEVTDTPFVYVRKTDTTVVVRPSNDIEHPYVFTLYDDFWHCRWHSDARGDSIMVDRFIYHIYVFEYIQRLKSDGKVYVTLNKINYHSPLLTDGDILSLDIYGLGIYATFDLRPWEHFHAIIDRMNEIKSEYRNKRELPEGCSLNYKTLVVNHPDEQRRPTYLIGDSVLTRYYYSAPMGLYDDHADCGRIPALKRIR